LVLFYVGRFVLIEMRIRASSAVSLHFGDSVELSGWNSDSRNPQSLYRLRVVASSMKSADCPSLVLQVGKRSLGLNRLTLDDVRELGAASDGAGVFKLVFGPDSPGGNLQFEFRSDVLHAVIVDALDTVLVDALDAAVVDASEVGAGEGVPLFSILIAGSPGKLDLPCSQEEAIAFFGRPTRKVYQGRGGSVTVSKK